MVGIVPLKNIRKLILFIISQILTMILILMGVIKYIPRLKGMIRITRLAL